ncbi:unnamed protein product [Peronospora effusa]|nr:unnamed protein product [Peronospora effusa]
MAVAALTASNSAAPAAQATDDIKLWQANPQDRIDTMDALHIKTRPKRMLRGVSNEDYDVDNEVDNDSSTSDTFLEDRIQQKLAKKSFK